MGIKIEAKGTILVVEEDYPMIHHVLMSAITHMTQGPQGGCIYVYDSTIPITLDDHEAALAAWISYLNFDEYNDE